MSSNKNPKEHVERGKIIKQYFSSLTARKTSLMYVGILKNNQIILANLDPDKMVRYCEASLSLHILSIKKKHIQKYVKEIIDYLGIPSGPYVICINDYISYLNKIKFDLNVPSTIKSNDSGIYYYTADNDKKKVLAYPIVMYSVVSFLTNISDNIDNILKYINDEEDLIVYNRINLLDKNNGTGVFKVQIHLDSFKDKDGNNTFDVKGKKTIDINMFDGLETISVKEFIKKFKEENSSLDLIACSLKGTSCIEYISVYEDNNIMAISTRPHNRLYIKKKGN
jgi:hypothetical protein